MFDAPDCVAQVLCVLRVRPQIESILFASPHESISPIDSSYRCAAIDTSPDSHHLLDRQSRFSKQTFGEQREQNSDGDQLTPSFTAFRRKKALHGAHVATPKLTPTAASLHTRHGVSSLGRIVIGSNTFIEFCRDVKRLSKQDASALCQHTVQK